MTLIEDHSGYLSTRELVEIERGQRRFDPALGYIDPIDAQWKARDFYQNAKNRQRARFGRFRGIDS